MEVKLISKNCDLQELKNANDDLPPKLDQSIKHIIEREGYISHEIEKRCVSTNGGNYLGTLYEINIKGKTKDGDKELNIFVKHIIELESFKILSISDVYKTEAFAYKELAKIFAELQEEANVPEKERYKMVKVYKETNEEAIIMENIVKRGFTTYYRMDAMPPNFVKRAVQQLARFHALSFVIREKRPEYFNAKIKSLKNSFIFEDDWLQMTKSTKDAAMQYIDEEFKDRIEKIYKDLVVKYGQYCNDESIKACLCHGDYRANNIMVKLEEGEIQEIIPVDYQLMYYGCPVFDFLYLINTGTDKDYRKAHISNLKDLYHDTLSIFLKYFNLDANKVYPRKEFERVYKEKLDFGLMSALVFLPFVLASESDVPDLSNDVSGMVLQVDYRFKERLRGIIEDYVEWGYI